ncbi:CAP domain-containing protein [Rubinisphaera margarita]|uniref:CAP domain-containing protein n=1 Tax=Rubinisphaera margarita TaxID=2909586 RepID=UPI001EE85B9F|nr:CAP domain-containing protein [Rubinisphaera margarita]MCG6154247.1 CAP domain-containing protein [Rubinisphaera margarita]
MKNSIPLLLLLLCISPSVRADEPHKGQALSELESLLVEKVNAYRQENDLGTLKVNEKLNVAALAHADTMIETDNFSHQAGDSNPSDRVENAGYTWMFVAENLAFRSGYDGYSTEELARITLEGWQNSPGHNKNLLAEQPTETGIAIKEDTKSGRTYTVMLYATPR